MRDLFSRSAFLAVVAIAASAACCNSFGCRGGRALLTVRPEKPRLVVFISRSFTGSRKALIASGEGLLMSSPSLKVKNGSRLQTYLPSGANPGFMVSAIVFETSLPIENLLGLAQAVEERLSDPKHPGARETLRLDLVYVQHVSLKTPRLELPHPALFDHPEAWAIVNFAMAYEEYASGPLEAFRLRNAWNNAAKPFEVLGENVDFDEPELKRGPLVERWKVEGSDWSDGLAFASRARAVAYYYRELGRLKAVDTDNSPVIDDDFSSIPIVDAYHVLGRVPATVVEAIEISVPDRASDSQIAEAWLHKVANAERVHEMRLSSVVVFQADKETIRGAVLGTKRQGAPPGIEILDVSADRDPADSRGVAEYHGVPNGTEIEFSVRRSLSKRSFTDQP